MKHTQLMLAETSLKTTQLHTNTEIEEKHIGLTLVVTYIPETPGELHLQLLLEIPCPTPHQATFCWGEYGAAITAVPQQLTPFPPIPIELVLNEQGQTITNTFELTLESLI